MAITEYVTREGDRLDQIAYKIYGSCDAAIIWEIMRANYWLREDPPVLPAGRRLKLPIRPAVTENNTVKSSNILPY